MFDGHSETACLSLNLEVVESANLTFPILSSLLSLPSAQGNSPQTQKKRKKKKV
jgi:hypothetical protein